MATEKKFVGKGVKFGEYEQISINVCLEDMKPGFRKAVNGKHYINLVVTKMKEKDKNGKTHTVYVDQWEKTTDESKKASAESEKELTEQYGPAGGQETGADNIPF
jgi:hypothetical protein